MVEQVYYSIDREPGICARYIAQAIKAGEDTGSSHREPSAEEVRAAAEKIAKTWEKLALRAFMGGLG